MADSLFTITFTFTDTSQALADAKRDAALLDFAKANSLDIYLPGTQTIDPTKVGPAIRAQVKQQLRNQVVEYRAANTGSNAAAAERTAQLAAINP